MLHIFAIIAAIAAIVGQCADAWTTYWGIYILKMDSEGDTFWFTQWIAASKWRLLTIKPAFAVLIAVATLKYFSAVTIDEYFGIACLIALAASGIDAGLIHNLPLNIKQAESKK